MLAVELTLTNKDLVLRNVPPDVFRAIDLRTSFAIPGAEWTQAYRRKVWDGRQHLVRFSKRIGGYHAPAGLIEEVLAGLKEAGITEFDFVDHREAARTRVEYRWRDELRWYQEEAAAAVLKPRGPLKERARCALKMSIRAGKTRTAAKLIAELATRTLFIVNSQLLLAQAQRALSKALGVMVGQIGDGVWDVRDCTVATIQTLLRRQGGKRKVRGEDRIEEVEMDPRVAELLANVDLLIIDEAHHMEADRWRTLLLACPARYRIGLTATLPEENDALLMRAATGPIVYEVAPSTLIREGFLMRPDVRLYPVREPKISHYRRWSASLGKLCITENEERNAKIVSVVRGLVRDEHLRTLVTADRLEHIASLKTALEAAGLRVATIVGSDSASKREDRIDKLVRRRLDVVVSNVLGEGVDVPELEAVVHAGGGSSSIAAMQRMRCLTPSEGKKTAVFVDFMDLMHPIFAEHSRARLAVYKSEVEFRVRLAA